MIDMRPTIEGITGRHWVVDTREQAAPSGNSTPFYGWEVGDEDHRVWVQRAMGGDDWKADRLHLHNAYAAGQIPMIGESPYVHSPIDFFEGYDAYLFSELAESNLARVLRDGPLDPAGMEDLEERLRHGLAAIHGSGHVHCDVREENILRVGGRWKIGDLGGITRVGDVIVWTQKDPEYRHPDLNDDLGPFVPADPAYDLYALDVVLRHAVNGL